MRVDHEASIATRARPVSLRAFKVSPLLADYYRFPFDHWLSGRHARQQTRLPTRFRSLRCKAETGAIKPSGHVGANSGNPGKSPSRRWRYPPHPGLESTHDPRRWLVTGTWPDLWVSHLLPDEAQE